MQKITINPSIAVIVDIASVGHKELENIYFKADSNWLGDYDCKIWNSYQKNTQFTVSDNVTVAFSFSGYEIIILKTDSSVNTVTVKGSGSELINRLNTYILTAQDNSVRLISSGIQSYILRGN